jgi:ubiquinone/menaquinone biosynthesis C-methylase UbiE
MIDRLMRFRDRIPRRFFDLLREIYWDLHWRFERVRVLVRDRVRVPSLTGTERAELAEEIVDEYPFESLLEIGCGYGQSVEILAGILPEVQFTAIDTNPVRVDMVVELARKRGYSKLTVLEADVTDLSRFGDKSFDVVYSFASLLYVRAEHIERAIAEMLRVCRRKLVLVEQQMEDDSSITIPWGRFIMRRNELGGYWVRDYRRLLSSFVSPQQIALRKIPRPLMAAESWTDLGCVITVRLSEG